MAQEIERKFLVKDDTYKRMATSSSRICQGYICSSRGRTVRVRIRGEKGFLTIKGPANSSGTSRFEWEKEIPLEDANELMNLCEPGKIDKTRFIVEHEGHKWEVDEFHGENEGLTVAEVELKDENEQVKLPDFIKEEVTGEVKYYNSFLIRTPFSTW